MNLGFKNKTSRCYIIITDPLLSQFQKKTKEFRATAPVKAFNNHAKTLL